MKPVLFLDFDRTLFDTDQFYDWMGPNRFERILELMGGHIEQPDYASYLYPDALSFLKKVRKSHRIVILSFALNLILQRKKLRGSGILPLVDDVIISEGKDGTTGKGGAAKEYLARIGDPGWEHVFVDDLPDNINEVKTMNPDIRCIRIDRKPMTQGMLQGDMLQPDAVVKNLTELENIL